MAEKCPDQYQKCLNKSGCRDKLVKCSGKCGIKVDYGCWAGCIGIFDLVAGNAATCAANNCMEGEEVDISFELIPILK